MASKAEIEAAVQAIAFARFSHRHAPIGTILRFEYFPTPEALEEVRIALEAAERVRQKPSNRLTYDKATCTVKDETGNVVLDFKIGGTGCPNDHPRRRETA